MCIARYPFLLVDRVVELDFQKSAVGYKNITMNDNFFTGHFPERAIMPGGTYARLASSVVCTLFLFYFTGLMVHNGVLI